MHHTIGRTPGVLGSPPAGRTRGITGLVYRSVRGVTGLVGGGIDAILGRLVPLFGASPPSPTARSARRRAQRRAGRLPRGHGQSARHSAAVPARRRAAADGAGRARRGDAGVFRQAPRARARPVPQRPPVEPAGSRPRRGARARSRLHAGLPALQHRPPPLDQRRAARRRAGDAGARNGPRRSAISRSSRTAWAGSWRAARATMAPSAGHAWLEQLRALVFLGTPHHGAPMERGGNWIDALLGVSPYSAPFARLGKIRSAGITDLRYGNLIHEDWQGRDRFARGDRRRFVPLPEGVRCYAIAATTAQRFAAVGTDAAGRRARPGRERARRARQAGAGTAHSEIPAVDCPRLRSPRSARIDRGLPADQAVAGCGGAPAPRRRTRARARNEGQITREYCAFCCASRRYRSKCIATVRTRSRPRIVTLTSRSVSTTSPSAASGASDARSGAK